MKKLTDVISRYARAKKDIEVLSDTFEHEKSNCHFFVLNGGGGYNNCLHPCGSMSCYLGSCPLDKEVAAKNLSHQSSEFANELKRFAAKKMLFTRLTNQINNGKGNLPGRGFSLYKNKKEMYSDPKLKKWWP